MRVLGVDIGSTFTDFMLYDTESAAVTRAQGALDARRPGTGSDRPDVDRLPLLDEVRSLLAAAEYRRPWETHVHWTRLAAGLQNASS